MHRQHPHDYADRMPRPQMYEFVEAIETGFKIAACAAGFYGLMAAVYVICGFVESFA